MGSFPNGLWIWKLKELPKRYLKTFADCGVKRVYLKVLDGKTKSILWADQCNDDILSTFRDAGIEVWGWGYHYGAAQFGPELDAIKAAFSMGIAGYVFDAEAEIEDASRYGAMEGLLKQASQLFAGKLGYSSFGHPGLHPSFPWRTFDKYCDFAFPQIYYESFTFGATDEEEVQACLKAHATLGLKKPIYPIWSSEAGAKHPADATSLQGYLDRFAGSSIWRAPSKDEVTQALNLNYAPGRAIASTGDALESPPEGAATSLPPLTRVLKIASVGPDVTALQELLIERGILDGGASGEFDGRTAAAVRLFQTQAGIAVDGIVGPQTWSALGGDTAVIYAAPTPSLKIADVAMAECRLGLKWTGPDSDAEKYLAPLRAPMQKLGQIGKDPVFYNWCAAFVTWCARQAGVAIPDQPSGFWATMALVDSWPVWAKQKGYWMGTDTSRLVRGDIVVFEWNDGDTSLDHIGIVASFANGELRTYEGNRGNQAVEGGRNLSSVAGVIRISG